MATLVPERREELTTEGGLDVAGSLGKITAAVNALTRHGTEVSLFIEPDMAQIRASLSSGVRFVEFHTGAFANAHESGDEGVWKSELARLNDMTRFARESGLTVNMGHGLNYRNTRLVAAIEGVYEFNIGHAIVARAMLVGFERAVREMLELTQ
jgi:pyridoxine 5-phosphate synthase